eukprot:6197788-Amphidinium_carterae.1
MPNSPCQKVGCPVRRLADEEVVSSRGVQRTALQEASLALFYGCRCEGLPLYSINNNNYITKK